MSKITRYPIAVALAVGLLLVATLSLVASLLTLWMTTVLSGDAKAVNLSGSLRMQSYRLAYTIESGSAQEQRLALLDEFEIRLLSDQLKGQIPDNNPELRHQFELVEQRFYQMRNFALKQPNSYLAEVDSFVGEIDYLVELLERWSESKVQSLRRQQVILGAVSVIAAALVAGLILNRIVTPLQSLMAAVLEIRQGNRNARSDYLLNDEFGELAYTFNKMTKELSEIHELQETKIAEQTRELSRQNQTLEFLFNLSQSLSVNSPNIEELKEHAINELLLLCPGKRIYWTNNDTWPKANLFVVRCHNDRSYLVCQYSEGLEPWQERILETVRDLFDSANNRIKSHKSQNRIDLLNERSSIARELHDSLAQQLSYLKIQVVRWIKLKERGADGETLDGIIMELRDGLNSSYRKLRELLVTFRAHSDEPGLIPSVKAAADEINRINQSTKIHLYIDENWPEDISPGQEIHCLHVIREALTNVIKHAQAENAVVSLKRKGEDLEICINDDGIGYSHDEKKPGHYGLSIMSERAERINGTIEYKALTYGGTGVKLTFKPEYQTEEESI